MVVLGLLIGLVGTDVNSGMARYAFDIPELVDGIGFTVIAVGLFAVSEIVTNLERREPQPAFTGQVKNLMPTLAEIKRSFWPALRCWPALKLLRKSWIVRRCSASRTEESTRALRSVFVSTSQRCRS
jgi:hypothetical protein